MVPHACRVMSRALHAYEMCEACHIWLCDLVNYVISELSDYLELCTLTCLLGDISTLEIMLLRWWAIDDDLIKEWVMLEYVWWSYDNVHMMLVFLDDEHVCI